MKRIDTDVMGKKEEKQHQEKIKERKSVGSQALYGMR